jgi:hypothetical protein
MSADSWFATLEELCAGRHEEPPQVRAWIAAGLTPAASHAEGGRELFPRDYFTLIDRAGGPRHLRQWFIDRCGDVEEWDRYVSGDYGRLLARVTPDAIVRAGELTRRLRELLDEPTPRRPDWHRRFRVALDELNAILLERHRHVGRHLCHGQGRSHASVRLTV